MEEENIDGTVEENLNLPPEDVDLNFDPVENAEEPEVAIKEDLPESDKVEDKKEETEEVKLEVEPEENKDPVIQKPKPKLHFHAKTKNQINREIRSAQYKIKQRDSEIENLRMENEKLKNLYEQHSQAAMTHYDDSIKLRAQQAEINLKLAIENADTDAQLAASKELARAIADEKEVERWKSQQEFEKRNMPKIEESTVREVDTRNQLPQASQEWLELNPWADESHEDYDEELALEAAEYAKELNDRYIREGKPNLRWSNSYFREINSYMNDYLAKRDEGLAEEDIPAEPKIEPVMVRKPVMSKSRPPVAPINRGSNNSTSKVAQEINNPIERELVDNLKQAGVIRTDTEWKAWKDYDKKFVAALGHRHHSGRHG